MSKNWHFLYFFILISLGCAGGVGGTSDPEGNSDGGAAGTDDETINSLFETGPVDIPITIAKLKAPDPKHIDVELIENIIRLTGEAGALPDDDSCSKVWVYDTVLEQEQTSDKTSGGGFSEITFTHASDETPSTNMIVACYDGTTIGIPVFLKIEEGHYVWLLTNGAELKDGALSVLSDTVFLVSETDISASINQPAVMKQVSDCSDVESNLYSLSLAGEAELVATGCLSIDRVFAVGPEVVIQSGATFYQADSEEFVEACELELNAGETIGKVSMGYDADNENVGIYVATNEGLYYCSFGESLNQDFSTAIALEDNQEVTAIVVSDDTGTGRGLNVTYGLVDTSTGQLAAVGGSAVAAIDAFGFVTQSLIDSTPEDISPTLDLSAMTFTEGLSTDFYSNLANVTRVSSGTAGSSSATGFVIFSDVSGSYYLLDYEMSIMSNGTATAYGTTISVDNLIDLENIRTIHDIQIHPSGYAVFFCADDASGNGQIYAFCPSLLPASGSPDGSEIIQITEGSAHCDERNNWRVDQDSDEGSLVIVDVSNADAPQIRFVDPTTDPLLAGCFP